MQAKLNNVNSWPNGRQNATLNEVSHYETQHPISKKFRREVTCYGIYRK